MQKVEFCVSKFSNAIAQSNICSFRAFLKILLENQIKRVRNTEVSRGTNTLADAGSNGVVWRDVVKREQSLSVDWWTATQEMG